MIKKKIGFTRVKVKLYDRENDKIVTDVVENCGILHESDYVKMFKDNPTFALIDIVELNHVKYTFKCDIRSFIEISEKIECEEC